MSAPVVGTNHGCGVANDLPGIGVKALQLLRERSCGGRGGHVREAARQQVHHFLHAGGAFDPLTKRDVPEERRAGETTTRPNDTTQPRHDTTNGTAKSGES
jgi:hypothetical protein